MGVVQGCTIFAGRNRISSPGEANTFMTRAGGCAIAAQPLFLCAGHMADELNDIIEAAAADPKKATVDGTTVEAHSLKDLVEAAKFLNSAGSTAVSRPNRGIRITKLVPPGATE